jgi:surface protein
MPKDVITFLESIGIDTKSKTGNHLFDAITVVYKNRELDLVKFLKRNNAPESVMVSAENFVRPINAQLKISNAFKILISRKKAEIAAGSTCTSWKSCLSPFNGKAWDKVPEEVKYGTLIAYVLRASATPNEDGEYDANGLDGKPDKIGRVMIKMFESSDGEITFGVEDKRYGHVTDTQLKMIKNWVKKNYHIKEGIYKRNSYTYKDTIDSTLSIVADVPDYIKAESNSHLRSLIKKYKNQDDLNFIDVSGITNMSDVFDGVAFNGDISKWDVSKVTNMYGMFSMSTFDGDISNWDVSNVTNMNSMFYLSDFNGNISNWDVSNVTNMNHMFATSAFDGDISKWNVSDTTSMDNMFQNAPIRKHPPKWYKGD